MTGEAPTVSQVSGSSSFEKLLELRRGLEVIYQSSGAALEKYYEPRRFAFRRLWNRRSKTVSLASTSTCVLAIDATGAWGDTPWEGRRAKIATTLLTSPWESDGLNPRNAFATAFVLEASAVLLSDSPIDPALRRRMKAAETILRRSIANGAARFSRDHDPSAYLTQLVVRALERVGWADRATREKVQEWAWTELERQLVLIQARSQRADAHQLAYAITLVATLDELAYATPDRTLTLRSALDCFFGCQLDDGHWPPSQPLYHPSKSSVARCFEYEVLVQLLSAKPLHAHLVRYLDHLAKAAGALELTAQSIGDDARGWSSGHDAKFQGPESWSTASVAHFAYALDRLLAQDFVRLVYAEVGVTLEPVKPESDPFGSFLDCDLKRLGEPSESLSKVIRERFLAPIGQQAMLVDSGKRLPRETPMSAILFGPPGTSKTELAKIMSRSLGWPLLTVDPSYYVKEGLDRIEARADTLFRMLSESEGLVVLLDEFDEMVRARTKDEEVLSRLLTTAMLPKLATLRNKRRLVFLVATNHIETFDLAIRRPGRFDMVVQVMPPTLREKLRKWTRVRQVLVATGLRRRAAIVRALEDLTFLEFERLEKALPDASSATEEDVRQCIQNAHDRCALSALHPQEKLGTWKEVCDAQREYTVLPPLLATP